MSSLKLEKALAFLQVSGYIFRLNFIESHSAKE